MGRTSFHYPAHYIGFRPLWPKNVRSRNALSILRVKKFFPPENKDVGIREYTEKKENRAASLLEMRQHMLGDHDYAAAVFIGGMEGVEDEYALFRQYHPAAPCYPIASTGAAARLLYDEHPGEFDERLLTELSYNSLFKDLIGV